MNSIFTRRSIREYDSRPVEPEKLDRILRAGMQAPSAMNRQPWEFLVVEKPEMIQKIAALTPYGKPAARAPMVLVPLVNLKTAGEKNRFWVQDLSACVQIFCYRSSKKALVDAGWASIRMRSARMRFMMRWACRMAFFLLP